ncbi:signal peptide containing protein [Theileria equi strain WA]|uniref:Signal peptide containing protein n=1 Tax=Theileria equi strain WA TaxID=1537102 RepID=L1LG09_THEEQ|nr:signal peptide containing protein [Theileria equi strain WA]EKX74098.1 signal peptide containing protein [Theileria equi strain WA]|eukprot:XP_004833550.1 signal peptide containing protein [Theileria equi strain WA]
MNVFSILLVTCLLGLCHCKRSKFVTDIPVIEVLDDYPEMETRRSGSSGKRLVWDMAHGIAYEEEYTQSLARRSNDRKVEDVAVDESPVPQTSRHTTTLDISDPDKDKCPSFDYTFAGNMIRLVVPKDGISVYKLVNGREKVWIAEEEEKFDHAKVYLNKDKKPELVLLVTTLSGTPKETYLELKNAKWVSCDDHDAKMRSLVSTAEFKGTLILNIEDDKDTKECTIFEVELLDVAAKNFFPKLGHNIIEVKDGDKRLWAGRDSDYCLSCVLYDEEDVQLLEVTVLENNSREKKYFEKVNGAWQDIDETKFDKEKGIRGGKFVSAFLDKVDESLFDVLGSLEDGVNVLRLLAKEGTSKLTYGSDTIWPGKKDVMCLSAILYMDGDQPTLAVIKTKDSVIYRYHDGKQWQNGSEGRHKIRLKKLKEKYEPEKTLDISKGENTDVGIYSSNCNDGTSIGIFDPRSTRVTKVVDGENVIWQAGGNEKNCTWAEIRLEGDQETLKLDIQMNKERKVEFKKECGKWKRISEAMD